MAIKKDVKDGRQTLVLLDTHAILHRAYHGVPDFTSSKGEPTGALYGLVNMLFKIIEQLHPTHIVACYDLPAETHRHAVYEKYKANRQKTDEALVQQIIKSRDVFTAFGIDTYELAGFEADDMLGTIVEQVLHDKKMESVDVIIASGDMDTMQLVVDDRVRVYTLRKGITDTVIYNEKRMVERYGFLPNAIPDYKGFAGDSSDNIPGIKGVGEKTATELLKLFGSVSGVYKAIKKDAEILKKSGFKSGGIEKIKNGEEEAEFSRMLATIRRDAPITFKMPEPWTVHVDIEKVRDLCERFEFRSLQGRVNKVLGGEGSEVSGVAAESSRTNSLVEGEQSPTRGLLREKLSVEASLQLEEAKVMTWLLASDISRTTEEDVLRFSKQATIPAAHVSLRAGITDRGMDFVYEKIEQPLIPIIERMNAAGVELDVAYLADLSKEYHTLLRALEGKIYGYAGTEFNLNSPKQLGPILYDVLKLKPVGRAKTPTGQASTKEADLVKMREQHAIIDEILEYRELQKLVSTYIDVLPTLVKPAGRLHSNFVQTGTTTGRLASLDPNLQNIPIKTEQGRRIRNAFVAKKGCVLVALDYAQIELRIAAMLSGEEKLVEAFTHNEDVHTTVAADVFGVEKGEVTKDMRRTAKVINFGILYGMGANALKENLGAGTTTAEARHYLDAYFQKYGTLARYIDGIKEEAAKLGYTTTLYGRRRYFEGIRSSIPFIRAMAERMAVNAPIQGTSADSIKRAMVVVDEYIGSNSFGENLRDKVTLVLQVHDELVYEVEEKNAKEIADKIKELMESVFPEDKTRGVPVIAEYKIGKNWGEMK
jgi:DNA polymerase I